MENMDENPYQSPGSSQRQPYHTPVVLRPFLSSWTGLAIAAFMLVNVVLALESGRVVRPYIDLVLAALAVEILWFAIHGYVAFKKKQAAHS
jgi:hypothetical protein